MLFDTKTMGDCAIHIDQLNIKDRDHFLFLRYSELHHNWDIQNAFVFDARRKVNPYVKIKVIK